MENLRLQRDRFLAIHNWEFIRRIKEDRKALKRVISNEKTPLREILVKHGTDASFVKGWGDTLIGCFPHLMTFFSGGLAAVFPGIAAVLESDFSVLMKSEKANLLESCIENDTTHHLKGSAEFDAFKKNCWTRK